MAQGWSTSAMYDYHTQFDAHMWWYRYYDPRVEKFAQPTEALAFESCVKRKERQIDSLSSQLDQAKRYLHIAKHGVPETIKSKYANLDFPSL